MQQNNLAFGDQLERLQSTPHPPRSKNYSDRFIPSRSNSNMQRLMLDEGESTPLKGRLASDKQERCYSRLLQNRLLDSNGQERPEVKKMLRFNSDKKERRMGKAGDENIQMIPPQVPLPRHVPSKPFKILDAPNLVDDFYLNLLDWGACDRLAIGLDNAIFAWKPSSAQVDKVA